MHLHVWNTGRTRFGQRQSVGAKTGSVVDEGAVILQAFRNGFVPVQSEGN